MIIIPWTTINRYSVGCYKNLIRWSSSLKVLGIESTCDDTCASVVTSDRKVLSDVRFSQLKIHVTRGGILPITARAKHALAINGVVKEALDSANCTIDDIDAVAVANRPGLILSLKIGVDYAQRLCLKYNKPLIGIHHMEAHALTAHLSQPNIGFPFLTLLISGGHTMLTLVKSIDEFYILSESNNSPVGEFLDKKARILKIRNLGSPYDSVAGGRAIEMLALNGNPMRYNRSLRASKSANFNFNISTLRGLWDSRIRKVSQSHPDLPVDCPLPEIADLAAGIQQSIVTHLGLRINRIVKYLESTDLINIVHPDNCRSLRLHHLSRTINYIEPRPVRMKLVISGGVACNRYIVDKLADYCSKMGTFYDETKIEVTAPSPRHLCTDNGVMIAWNGVLKLIDNNCDNNRGLLRQGEEIMDLEAIYDAQLGVDIRHLLYTSCINVKSLQV